MCPCLSWLTLPNIGLFSINKIYLVAKGYKKRVSSVGLIQSKAPAELFSSNGFLLTTPFRNQGSGVGLLIWRLLDTKPSCLVSKYLL